jgi:hypothetical protein
MLPLYVSVTYCVILAFELLVLRLPTLRSSRTERWRDAAPARLGLEQSRDVTAGAGNVASRQWFGADCLQPPVDAIELLRRRVG